MRRVVYGAGNSNPRVASGSAIGNIIALCDQIAEPLKLRNAGAMT